MSFCSKFPLSHPLPLCAFLQVVWIILHIKTLVRSSYHEAAPATRCNVILSTVHFTEPLRYSPFPMICRALYLSLDIAPKKKKRSEPVLRWFDNSFGMEIVDCPFQLWGRNSYLVYEKLVFEQIKSFTSMECDVLLSLLSFPSVSLSHFFFLGGVLDLFV